MNTHDSLDRIDLGRRDFLCRISLMAGAAAAVSLLPGLAFSSPEAGRWRGESPAPYRFTDIDEALDNYPGYSAAIGFGRGHLLAAADHAQSDDQLFA